MTYFPGIGHVGANPRPLPGPGDFDPPGDTPEERRHEALLEDQDAAKEFIADAWGDDFDTILSLLLVHGLPSNRESNSGWQDQYWCQCDDALTRIQNQFDDWALEKAQKEPEH